MKKLILILIFAVTAISLNAALINKSGNVIKVFPNGEKHAIVKVYENASDSAALIIQFSTYIGNQLNLAKDLDLTEDMKGKTPNEIESILRENIIISESKNGGIFKYRPDLDAVLIEELRLIDLK